MSFNLPRRPVSLRFTGELKALDPPDPKEANALGQTRPKAPPTNRSVPRSPAPPPLPQRKADVYAVEMQPTPYVGSRPSERAEAATLLPAALAAKSPEIRVQLSSMSDHETEALDRGELGLPSVLRSPPEPSVSVELAPPPPSSPPPPKPNPWAHHRSADAPPPPPEKAAIATPRAQASRAAGGPLSLSAWIAIAIMAGIVSYTFAPAAFTSIERATGLVETR
ncbi:MAG: hypothetical protein JST00_22935 [Deltaproteobacteria bacterium]|nr:hypothetical protein [Deltaproteobacteria bacterium]